MQASSGGSPDKAIQDYYGEESFLIKDVWLGSIIRNNSKIDYLMVNFDQKQVNLFELDDLIIKNQ